MRVLHLSTVDQAGGAARAAWNLSQALRAIGCDSRMLVRDPVPQPRDHPAVIQAGRRDKALEERHHEASFIQRKLVNPSRSPVSNTWFSLPEPGWDISGHPEVARAEVLHLHWVSGFLSPASIALLQETGKPVFWTLHDQRPFTGGCHFSAGCRRFQNDCEPCPQLVGKAMFGLTRAALAEARRRMDPQRLTVICPSVWMAECARRSALFSASQIEVIPYGVDTEVFRPGSADAREQLGWPGDGIVLLAGAWETGEIRKGFGLLTEALRICGGNAEFRREAQAGRIRLVLFGRDNPLEGLPLPVECLGRIDSPKDLARVYAAANVLLVPSIEDNLPNTMLEALCCGTPVIGFRIGGMPDAITPGENGRLVDEVSAAALAAELQAFCLDPRRRELDRAQIASAAAQQFRLDRQAESCLALYRAAAGSRQVGTGTARPVCRAPASPEYEREFGELLQAAKRAQWQTRLVKIGRRIGLGRRNARAND
jgi:glycosyltransferase involved in cell wall biosynthesis